jgi:hypothetical protein
MHFAVKSKGRWETSLAWESMRQFLRGWIKERILHRKHPGHNKYHPAAIVGVEKPHLLSRDLVATSRGELGLSLSGISRILDSGFGSGFWGSGVWVRGLSFEFCGLRFEVRSLGLGVSS